MRRGCRPETAGPPHTTAGGGGRAAAAGPKRPRGGPGAENVSGLACPRPLSGGGAGRRLGGRGARTRRDTRARPGLFIRAGARARRADLSMRVAAGVRVPGPDISVPGAAARGQERLSEACARLSATPGFGSRALLLGGGAAASAHRTPLLRGGAAGGRLAV